ncbi:MAG: galactokinase [Candidatus Sumerlaeota bacterium]|nr:galactokinase [Candidatus Sumerlaeota bacterium]
MPLDALKGQAIRLFRERFGAEPTSVGFGPGRVEILGNHTDYNGGFVLPVALDRAVAVAGAPLAGGRIELTSALFEGIETAQVGQFKRNEKTNWVNYPLGTLKMLAEAGAPVGGMRFAVASTVPLGSGLSSSAALEVATAQLALTLYPFAIEKMALARVCQRAENEFVGMNCGILDQFSSIFGERNAALFLDCQSLEHRAIPIGDDDVAVVVANSMTKHELISGGYNRIRQECMEAAEMLGKLRGRPATLLREITMEDLQKHETALPERLRKRAHHVLTENQRVLDGVAALERGDLRTLGRLMFESHASSRDYYGNSTPELDCLVDLAKNAPGVIGAKLSGGGFGGCSVSLIRRSQADAFIAHIKKGFQERIGLETEIHLCAIGAGAHAEKV